MITRLSYLFHTLRHLKPRQGIALISQRFFPDVRIRYTNLPVLGSAPSGWLPSATKRNSLQLPDQFCFLNETHQVTGSEFWNVGASSYLWHYNLHYFDFLLSPIGYDHPESVSQWLDRWIQENPYFKGMGWDPYPTSLRIVNWLKFSWQQYPLTLAQVNSLGLQARWLSANLEHHLLANHLFTNAKALVFAGLAFSGDEALSWLRKGLKILLEQIPEQFMDDGGHFERCPMYQGILLEDLLDLLNLIRGSVVSLANLSRKTKEDIENLESLIIQKWDSLWNWYTAMQHPSGEFPLFNDSAYGVAPEFEKIQDYAERLKLTVSSFKHSSDPQIWFGQNSQFARLGNGQICLFWDIGGPAPSYQPGHSHAGTLGFELSLDQQKLIVDTGISTYEVCPQRLFERSTKAHNTLSVDDLNSSEIWSSFRVARRAKTYNYDCQIDHGKIKAICCHDGYAYIPSLGIHQRQFELSVDKLTVLDQITGHGYHRLQARFHLGPAYRISIWPNKSAATIYNSSNVSIGKVKVDGALFVCEKSTYHPEFGKSIEIQCLVAYAKEKLPFSIRTTFDFR